jgi:cytochrome c peroxidase
MRSWTIFGCLLLLITSGSLLLESCYDTDVLERRTGTPYTLEIPEGFPAPVYNFSNNPLSKEGVELGRHLFYEGLLSKDGGFPCASCHQQVAAFTTFDHDLSHGYNNSHTKRNAPGLANLAWYPAYRQDGSGTTLESVSLAHITAPDEMAETMPNVVAKLQGESKYRELFKAAYGDERINDQRLLNALTQFLLSMVSAGSKYDQVKKGQATFTAQEQNGYQVFQAKCATCHTEPLFTDFSYRNIGLPIQTFLNDYGRMHITNNRADSLKFRVPSLRNVDLTSYYTHDGRSGTMRHMVEHYRSRVQQGLTLDPLLTNGISMTNTELDNVLAFLRTLSDQGYTTNPKFGQP